VLAARNRLRRSVDYRRTVRYGARASRPTLVLHILLESHDAAAVAGASSHEAAPAQVGFVVGRAVGGAVVRNRVQRRLRHLLRERVSRLPAGSMVVVRATPAAAGAQAAALAQDVDAALSQLVGAAADRGRR
jgi:ribonuclease P protein component